MVKKIKLADLVEKYFVEHELFLSPAYREQIDNSLSVFKQFLGCDPMLSHLNPKDVNGLIASLKSKGRKPKTIKHRRNSLLCLWKWAYESMLTDLPPRAKRVALKPVIPEVWTVDEICRLLATMAIDVHTMTNRIDRGIWFASLSLGLYSSGLRLSDLLKARRIDVNKSGAYKVTQGKTSRQIVRTIDPRALGLILSQGDKAREEIWELPYNVSWVHKHFKVYTARAGLRGTTRFLRRSSATHCCEKEGIDSARRFLDHRSVDTLVNHYLGVLDTVEHPGPMPLPITFTQSVRGV